MIYFITAIGLTFGDSSKGKGKGLPQQAEVVQRVSGRLRPPDFHDFRHYEGVRSSALHTGRLYSRRNTWYSFLEAESTPGSMVLLLAMEKIPSDTTGNRSRDRELVAQCLNHYATRDPK